MSRGRGNRSRIGIVEVKGPREGFYEEPGGLRWLFRDAKSHESAVVGTVLCDPSATHRYFEPLEERDALPLRLVPRVGSLAEKMHRPRRRYEFIQDGARHVTAAAVTMQFQQAESIPAKEKRAVLVFLLGTAGPSTE